MSHFTDKQHPGCQMCNDVAANCANLRDMIEMYGFIPCAMLDYLEINLVQENTVVYSES